MKLEDYFDFLSPNDIRLKGHRIGIESVLYEYVHNHKNPNEIVERLPTLNLEQIHATILYYLSNEEQVNEYMAEWLEYGRQRREAQDLDPPPVIKKLRRIKEERQAEIQRTSG